MAESPLAAAPARAAAADSIVDADDYDAQLEVVRSLKAAGASPTRVKSAAMKLAQLKRATWVPSGTASRKKKRRAAIDAVKEGFDPSEVEKMEAARDAAAVAEYPQRDPPPMDADGFVVSFPPPRVRTAVNTEGAEGGADTAVHDDDDAAAMVFFRLYGFVVYRDVLSNDECASTRAEIWNHLERVQFPPTPGASRCLSRHDRTTWDLMDNVATYGLAPDPAVFTRQLVRNRQNPRVLACLAAVLRRETIYDSPTASTSEHSCVPSELTPACLREVIVSQDRWCVYRPTVNVPVGSGDGTTDKPEWRTRPNVHLDLHPWNFNARDGADVLPTEDLTFENPGTSAGRPTRCPTSPGRTAKALWRSWITGRKTGARFWSRGSTMFSTIGKRRWVTPRGTRRRTRTGDVTGWCGAVPALDRSSSVATMRCID